MIKVSYCLIYKNEEKHLPKWIKSALAVGDEIIAVDTGSTDGSNELLLDEDIEPIYHEWNNDFSEVKNFALSKATGNWIVFMDADEYFSDEQQPSVRPMIERIDMMDKNKEIQIIECDMYNIDEDDHDKLISKMLHWRIYRNLPDLKYRGKIHEALYWSGDTPLKYVHSDIIIYHTGYSTNLYKQKGERNLEYLEREIEDSGGEMSVQQAYYMANTYMQIDDMENVKLTATRAIAGTDEELGPMAIKMYRALLRVEEKGGNDFYKKMDIINAGLARFDNHPDLLLDKIKLLYEKHHFYECETLAAQVFQKIQDTELMRKYESVAAAALYMLHELLASIAFQKRDVINARAHIVETLMEKSRDGKFLMSFVKYFNGEKLEIMAPIMERLYGEPTEEDMEVFKLAFNNFMFGDVYLEYVKPAHGSFEHNMCKKRYAAATKAIESKLKKLHNEARYYYKAKRAQVGKALEFVVPRHFLEHGAGAKEKELTFNDVEKLLNEIAQTNSKLALALISMEDKEFSRDKTQKLLPTGVKSIVLAARGASSGDIDTNLFQKIYDDIEENSTHEARERLARAALGIKDDLPRLTIASKFVKKGELPAAYAILEGVKDKTTADYHLVAGVMYYYNETFKDALPHFRKARELGLNTDEVKDFIKWSNNSNLRVALA